MEKFQQICLNLNIHDLSKDKANYTDNYDDRRSLVKHVKQIVNLTGSFCLRGSILEIGSCWDGSKLGSIDEIDLLFVLDESQNDIKILDNHRVVWQGEEYSVREFCCIFFNKLDEVLCNDLPAGFEHGGYASPEYSGVRMNGPAATVLLKKCNTTSLDITLCFPAECDEVESWIKSLVPKCDNFPLPTDLTPHLVAYAVGETWEISTAHIEAQLFHELRGSIIQEAQIRNKVLLRMVDEFASQIYDNANKEKVKQDVDENPETNNKKNNTKHGLDSFWHSCRISGQMSKEQYNRYMRYNHGCLPEPTKYGELHKPHLSTNNAASKHILFRHASHSDDFRSSKFNSERMFCLMKCGIEGFSTANSDTHVEHIAQKPPAISKFSCRRTAPLEDYHQMVINHRALYAIVLKYAFTKVSKN